MNPKARTGVSSYLEMFLLISIALGGSAIAGGAAWSYSGSVQGPAVMVSGAAITQGSGAAVETLTVYNGGPASFASLTVTTPGVAATTRYCYSVFAAATQSAVSSTCPTLSTDPTSIQLPVPLQAGTGVIVVIILSGTPFTIGGDYPVTVGTPMGAAQTVEVEASAY